MLTLKHELYNQCLAYIALRMDTAQRAIQFAQASANEETKSSAGDKYETGRAMMQLEIEKNSIQLTEAMKLKQVLNQINPDEKADTVKLGSLVITDQANFYIAISAGMLTLDGKNYFSISPTSPVGAQLMNKKVRSSFTFNGKTYTIDNVL